MPQLTPRSPSGALGRSWIPRARRTPLALIAAGVVMILTASAASAATAPRMGTTSDFSILAGAGITNTGPTVIHGDVGSHETTSISGFGPGTGTIHGENHAGDLVTQQAKRDLIVAYDDAAGAPTTMAVGPELGGLELEPGVYTGGALEITGTLTLDTLGNPHSVFIFQAASTLEAMVDSEVVVLNGAIACNVFWQVTSSATLNTGADFIGNVLALTDIHARTGATVQGRLLARNGEVTLQSNTVGDEVCSAIDGGTDPTPSTVVDTTPTTLATTTATGTGATPTGGGSSTATPTAGTPRAAPTPTGGDSSTGLARTGVKGWLPLAGGVTIAIGLAMLQIGNRRRPIRA